ncbi:sensor histidine kinase [Christiangramia echinicola]|uniref:sensor histidine kinase n=1 Tax=Christiangramia echinicola TaxID=279359 RepID=UPI00047DBE38|nr:ATP-binding protein [Christiangramia echinicola]
MNPLLRRQISKHLDPALAGSEEVKTFLEAIDSSYETHQEQFNMLQRAMQISSDELYDANRQLQKDYQHQKDILDSISGAINALNLEEFKKENGDFKIGDLASHIRLQSEKLQIAAKQQEELLRNLENKNKVLTDYAHMVSHDLKSPLRNINSLVSWIQEDCASKMDNNARENFRMILNNIEKMDDLINGILKYSTIDQGEIEEYEVDLKYLVHEIVEYLIVPDSINIKIDKNLPNVLGDKFKLQQLFQNLIQNAIKSITHDNGLIEIKVEDAGEMWRFEVKDNGRGIPERYHHKIFGIFEKIENDQAATGIGLSIVKKVVEHYGGSISLKSEEGKGTSFYFTIPK